MVDNIKISDPLASLSSTKRVRPVGHRQNNSQRNSFKETSKDRQKKKKEDSVHANISGKSTTAGIAQNTRHAVANKKSKDSIPIRIIDIRV